VPLLTDPAAIRPLLAADPAWAIYALGDLQPGYFHHCECRSYGDAVLLLYRGADIPVLFTQGPTADLEPLLDEIQGECACYLSIRPEALPLVKRRWRVEQETLMWRMVLTAEGADPGIPTPAPGAQRLGAADLEAVRRLYADGKGGADGPEESPDFFYPYMLEHGVFYGVFAGEALVSAAGTHITSPSEGVAAVGNVYTRRDRRGQGLAKIAVAAVAGELRRQGIATIALNVKQTNAPAIRVYEALGFARYCPFYEGLAVREG
jgi:ribosomal protein S18 acetylase RimI-like enzyme